MLKTQVLIIGGGATGTGLARDLALRGIRFIVAEQGDINSGASGANHGLLHSGGRYVFTDPDVAAECRAEAELLKQMAPQCIETTDGLFVAVEGDDDVAQIAGKAGSADEGATGVIGKGENIGRRIHATEAPIQFVQCLIVGHYYCQFTRLFHLLMKQSAQGRPMQRFGLNPVSELLINLYLYDVMGHSLLLLVVPDTVHADGRRLSAKRRKFHGQSQCPAGSGHIRSVDHRSSAG